MDNKINTDSGAASLPLALTARILQNVPQQQRLSDCALACKAWATAAAAATVHVEYSPTGATLPAFHAWVNQHAGQIITLQVDCADRYNYAHELLLPLNSLEQLQQLHLKGLKLNHLADTPSVDDSSNSSSMDVDRVTKDSTPHEAAAAAPLPPELQQLQLDVPLGEGSRSGGDTTLAAAAAAAALPRLQQLHLKDVELASIDSLLQLTQSQALVSVRLRFITFTGPERPSSSSSGLTYGDTVVMQQMVEGVSRLLQQLPRRIGVLEMSGFPIPEGAVQQIAAMEGLQELALSHLPTMPMCDLLLLPSSITQLEFKGHSSNPDPSTFPWELQQLAGLLQLKLSNCAVPPAVLQSFPRLQKLHVERCVLLPSDDEENPDDFDSRGALLDVLQQLTCLQRLELGLDHHRGHLAQDTEATPPHLFAALTASSCLTALILEPDYYIPLPKGAVQHMFGAGKQLPLLQRLAIFNYDDSNHVHGWPDGEWTIDGSDLHLIARCCPALQQLDIALNVNPDADLEGLLQLPQSCTSLNVGGAVFDDDAANLVVQLTQLQDLCWNKSPGFTDEGLETLASMNLGRLHIYDCALTDAVSHEGELNFEWNRYKGSVSCQIEALCDLSPVCAPERLRRQRAAAASAAAAAAAAAVRERVLQRENARLRAQLADRDEQLWQLRAELANRDAQLRQLQEALGGQQQ